MKQRSRRLAIVLTIVGLIAVIVAAVSLAVRPDWRDLPFWWLLLGLGALLGVLGFFDVLGATYNFFSKVFGWSESAAIEMPLQAVAVEELFQPFGRSANIAWVNRQQTSIDLLNRHPRLLIAGRMKIGKSREAAELIRQAVAGEMVPATRIFLPTPLLKVANAESVRQSLAQKLDPPGPRPGFSR